MSARMLKPRLVKRPTWPWSQRCERPRMHWRQLPQRKLRSVVTTSPCEKCRTFDPTASTTATHSCPSDTGYSAARRPSKRDTSEPQTPQNAKRTRTQCRGSGRSGLLTVSSTPGPINAQYLFSSALTGVVEPPQQSSWHYNPEHGGTDAGLPNCGSPPTHSCDNPTAFGIGKRNFDVVRSGPPVVPRPFR